MFKKITIRYQPIKGNRLSVFLDYYPVVEHPITGKLTRREFLNLTKFAEIEYEEIRKKDAKGIERRKFIPLRIESIDEKGRVTFKNKKIKLTILQKQHNDQIDNLAEQYRQRRWSDINEPEALRERDREFVRARELGNKSFIQFLEKIAEKKDQSNGLVWISAINHFKKFVGKDIRFCDLNAELINEFQHYLLKGTRLKNNDRPLARNSALSYSLKLRAALKSAYRAGYIQKDLRIMLDSVKPETIERIRLTEDEISKLYTTECEKYPLIRQVSLFMILTGLRFSDVQNITWDDVKHDDQGHVLKFRQKKTGNKMSQPLTMQAVELMGEPKEGTGVKVFEGLYYSASLNKRLQEWATAAGINKHVTWHTMRHSFATLQLAKGSSLPTIKRLLGHMDLKTTEIYAKVGDNALREAVNRIQLKPLSE